MGKPSPKQQDVSDEALERLRDAYSALGPGFPPQALALFEQESGESPGMWWRLGPRGQRRLLATSELTSSDLFSLPPTWEVRRVDLRGLSARRGLISASGYMYCRPRGSWENLRVPFLHTWTMCRDKALSFQSFLDEIELRPADEPTRSGG